MALLTLLALASGAVATGIAATRRNFQPRTLVDVLINGEPKAATLLPPKILAAITHAQQLARDLLGDTRQQYQQTLNTTYDATAEQSAEQLQKRNFIVAVTGLGLATVGALSAPIFYVPSIGCVLYAARTLFYDAYHFLVIERRIEFHLVLALSVAFALFGGFVWAAAFGAVWAMINYFLVAKTEGRSKQMIANLFGGQVQSVWMLVDGEEVEVPFAHIQIGDLLVVQAGEMVPVDGIITQGAAAIDQHMLTGEAQPAEKSVGDLVLAATVVLSGRIYLRVTNAGDATVAAQIGEMLSRTDDFQQTLQSRSDRLANQLILPVVGLSLVALPLAGLSGAVAVLWYYPGIRMTIFGPLSMLSFLQVAAQKGILIKDGRSLEHLHDIDTVVFDKTGTLTLEQPTVSRIFCTTGLSEAELLCYAAAAETKQTHPIARAILHAAQARTLQLPTIDDAHVKVGYGLKVLINGQTVRVGSIRFMQMETIPVPPALATQQDESHTQGNSLVLVAVDNEIAGAIELQPTIRTEANAIVAGLQARGMEIVIISGDNDEPTRRLAQALGIDRYYAEVLPEDKSNLVEQMQRAAKKVCFVGDGINDSIALKKADVSISLRGATTIATDAAQVVFMDGSLRQLSQLFELADEFEANMRVNLVAAMAPGILGIAGTLLFGWGMTVCVLLTQTSTPVGIYNAVKPLLTVRKNQIT